MKKIISLFVLTFILTGCFDKEVKDPNLVIKSETSSYELKLEHAVTPVQLMTGLQSRTKLAKQHGMLFDIRPARNIKMWMKDTLIPLDMIFVGIDNKVVKIVENTIPNSEDTISSDAVVKAVIEVNSGEAKKFEIKVGDIVDSKFLKNRSCNKAKACDKCSKDKKCDKCKDKAECGCKKKSEEAANQNTDEK